MNQVRINLRALPFLFLAFATFFVSIYLLKIVSFENSLLISGITIDLTITTAVFAFIFLRKQKINPLLIGPILILLIIIAGQLIPAVHQNTLQLLISYLIPAVELTIFGTIIWKIIQARKEFKSIEGGDFLRKLHKVLINIFGSQLAAKLAGTEIGMFYFLIFKWKKNKGFSYHKQSGVISVIFIVALLVVVETFVFHIMLIKYAPVFAWVLFGLSVYSFLQIVSLGKSIMIRTIYQDNDFLYLHYGWLVQADLQLDQILTVSETKISQIDEEEDFIFIGLLKDMEDTGILIRTKSTISVQKLFGKDQQSHSFFIPIDHPKEFIKSLEDQGILK